MMTGCDQDGERAALYVSGAMPESEQGAFEEHFFVCAECFRAVQALQDAREVLDSGAAGASKPPAVRFRLPIRWLAAAATVILAVVIWRLPRPVDRPAEPPAVAAAPAPVSPAPSASPVASPVERPVERPVASPVERPDSSDAALARMAAVVPPRYVRLPTRSEEDQDMAAFEAAMTHYAAGRYGRASQELDAIAQRSPMLAHVQFFLGVSQLMSGETAKARAALTASAASNVAPYADEAHFYLAKAALKDKDLAAARRELRIAVTREAGPDREAGRLLSELNVMRTLQIR